jgi:hypothetical protein
VSNSPKYQWRTSDAPNVQGQLARKQDSRLVKVSAVSGCSPHGSDTYEIFEAVHTGAVLVIDVVVLVDVQTVAYIDH